jgi:hypothetical protein
MHPNSFDMSKCGRLSPKSLERGDRIKKEFPRDFAQFRGNTELKFGHIGDGSNRQNQARHGTG